MLIFSCIALRGVHFGDVCCSLGVLQTKLVKHIDHDQNDDDDQNDATAADMVRIHLNDLFCFNSEILTSEKQESESRLINIPVLR